MALAWSASAAPLFLLCLPRTAGTGKFEEPSCASGATSNADWESESLGNKTDKVVIVGMTIRVTDTNTPAGEAVIQCGHFEGAAVIGPGKKGKVTELKVSKGLSR
jgi:hypothetical protein